MQNCSPKKKLCLPPKLANFHPAMFSEKPHGVMNAFGANTHQGISRNYNEDKVAIIANIQKPKHK